MTRPLRIEFVDAKTEKAAEEKMLVLSSQQGEMTEATLNELLKDSGRSIEDLMPTVRLPEVEIEQQLQQVTKTMAPPASAYDVVAKCESKKEANALAERLRKQGFTCRVKKSGSKHEREG